MIFQAAPMIFLGNRSPGRVAATNPLDEGGALRVPKKASLNRLEPSARRINWCLYPSTGAWHRASERDLPAFRLWDRKGAWHRLRARPGSQRCLAPGTCSARRLLASSCVLDRCLAPGWDRETGRDLLAFRRGIAKVPGTGLGGLVC